MNILGNVSKSTFLTTEADKTTVEFTVGTTAVKKGMPVKLAADGTIVPWAASDLVHLLIGYAYADAAIGGLCTVWTRGYAMIYAITTGALAAGPVEYAGYDSTTVIGGSAGATGYNTYVVASAANRANGWNLDQAAGANALIRVLLAD